MEYNVEAKCVKGAWQLGPIGINIIKSNQVESSEIDHTNTKNGL